MSARTRLLTVALAAGAAGDFAAPPPAKAIPPGERLVPQAAAVSGVTVSARRFDGVMHEVFGVELLSRREEGGRARATEIRTARR